MEPLSALAIAGIVMQIVSFSHEIYTVLRRIAKDGSPDENLANKSAQLSDLSQRLKGSLEMQQQTNPLTENQQCLLREANKCLNSANCLKEELDKIKWKPGPSGSNSRTLRRPVSQMWKWGMSKIGKLRKEMRDIEQTILSIMVTDVWLSQAAASVQQEEGFKTLDTQLKHFISQYAQACREVSALFMDQVSAQLQAQEVARATKDQCEIFLKSLGYKTMNARRSQVPESYPKTFKWIFNDRISKEWSSFSEWLKSNKPDQRIYWINGKAGSGKSTLMKFLYRHKQTRDALDKWATNAVIIAYFVWSAGDRLQRSVKGILCSLLYQLLDQDRSLIPRLITEKPELLSKINDDDWSETELGGILVRGISIATPLCIFLDGLDEIDQDESFDLVDLIERLRSESSAKLCISSRPEIHLQDAFCKYPKLQLQDLTKSDISRFVASRVASFRQENCQWRDVKVDHDENLQDIIDEVVRSADGVFLWVHLVLNSLRRGSVRIDNYEQMLGRIRELPKTLEGLYKQAWERLGEDQSRYREEAARYFRLVMEASELCYNDDFTTPFSLFNLSTCGDEIQSTFLDDKDKPIPPVTELLERATACRRRVESCCAGLLEFSEADDAWEVNEKNLNNFYCQFLVPLSAYVTTSNSGGEENIPQGKDLGSLWNMFYSVKVDFIHRTAVEFLVESEHGRNIINSDRAPASEIRAKIFQSHLIRMLIFFVPGTSRGRNTAGSSLAFIEKRLGSIPADVRRRLQILDEDTYIRLLDRAPVMEFIIKELRRQIREGQFHGTFYKILCDFASSTIAKYIVRLRPSFESSAGNVVSSSWGRLHTCHAVHCIHAVCSQILAQYESTTDLSRNVKWPWEMPKIEVPRHADVSSDDHYDLTFAHLLCSRWILVEASRCFRSETAAMVSDFLYKILEYQLVELAQRWFNRQPGAYDGIGYFKEILHAYPENTQEMQELLKNISESDVKVADHADSSEGRETPRVRYATLYMGGLYTVGERITRNTAVISNFDHSVHSDGNTS